MEPSIEFLFEEYAKSLELENIEEADYGKVIPLSNGDVHLCKGENCPHLILNEELFYVCSLSGCIVSCTKIRDDLSTGRITGSADPDANAGEPVGGKWAKKRDQVMMSEQANIIANSIDDTEEVKKAEPKKPAPKRGARCVDDEEVQYKPKRNKQTKNDTREAFLALCASVEQIITKLVIFDRRETCKTVKGARAEPKNMNFDELLRLALTKYARECLSLNVSPSVDTIHNIVLLTKRVAREQQKKQQNTIKDNERARATLLLKISLRTDVCSLAVKLWQAALLTPHMTQNRRLSDSFKPFVCGVLYALKRGVSLPDGTSVVPCCPELAAALPVLRATAIASQAKSLHASSHRGLCTLHKAIASCDPDKVNDVFREAAEISQRIVNGLKCGNYRY